MAERVRAPDLLRRARQIYDAAGCPLPPAAQEAWRGAFAGGGNWMLLALAHLRRGSPRLPRTGLNRLGLVKYGLAGGAALLVGALAVLCRCWLLLAVCVPAFYAVEAQMVFLFPLALDGSDRPFREARCWTSRAGGTFAVLCVVLPLAGTMLFGGFARQGFVRSWSLGCLAVCVWYEDLRNSAATSEKGGQA